jgi:hypothetical protein
MKTYGGVEHIIFDVSTKWMQLLSFTFRPIYHQEEETPVPTEQGVPSGNRNPVIQPVAIGPKETRWRSVRLDSSAQSEDQWWAFLGNETSGSKRKYLEFLE